MSTPPRPAPARRGFSHPATLTGNDTYTLTTNDAQHKGRYKATYTGPFDWVKKNWPKWDDMPKADVGDSGGPVFLVFDEDRSLGKPGYVHAIGIVILPAGQDHWRNTNGRNGFTGFTFQTIYSIERDTDLDVYVLRRTPSNG